MTTQTTDAPRRTTRFDRPWGVLFSHVPKEATPGAGEHAKEHPYEMAVDERGTWEEAGEWAVTVCRAQPGIEYEPMYLDQDGTWRSWKGECPGQVAARRWDR